MQLSDARFEAARIRVAILIENRIQSAKTRLGINRIDGEQHSIETLSDDFPRFAETIIIEGYFMMPIDDLHPSIGSFRVYAHKVASVVPYSGLLRARERGVSIYQQYAAHVDDDSFRPTGCVLMDQFDVPIAEFNGSSWLRAEDLPGPELWSDFVSRIDCLRNEAAFEVGWDNFSTAEHLRRKANSLERRLKMAQVQNKIS